RSSSSACTTAGVIHPAQTFSRGKRALSRIATSQPARTNRRAALDPAGPPPTTRTSQRCMVGRFVKRVPRPRLVVVGWAAAGHLEELQVAARKAGLGARKIQPPGPDKGVVERRSDPIGMALASLQPVLEAQGVMRPKVLDVEHR